MLSISLQKEYICFFTISVETLLRVENVLEGLFWCFGLSLIFSSDIKIARKEFSLNSSGIY